MSLDNPIFIGLPWAQDMTIAGTLPGDRFRVAFCRSAVGAVPVVLPDIEPVAGILRVTLPGELTAGWEAGLYAWQMLLLRGGGAALLSELPVLKVARALFGASVAGAPIAGAQALPLRVRVEGTGTPGLRVNLALGLKGDKGDTAEVTPELLALVGEAEDARDAAREAAEDLADTVDVAVAAVKAEAALDASTKAGEARATAIATAAEGATAKVEAALVTAAGDATAKAEAARLAAIGTAAGDATGKAEAARTAAVTTAAADAATKADAARAGAIATAAADASTKAGEARATAIAAAAERTVSEVASALVTAAADAANKAEAARVAALSQMRDGAPAHLDTVGKLAGALTAWRVISADTLARPGDRLHCNTAAESFTVTLPLDAPEGAPVTIRDGAGFFGAHPLTVAGNGRPFLAGPGPVTCDTPGEELHFFVGDGLWRYR